MKKSEIKRIIAIGGCIAVVIVIAITLYASLRNNRDDGCAEIIAEFNERAQSNPLQELTAEMANCMEDR